VLTESSKLDGSDAANNVVTLVREGRKTHNFLFDVQDVAKRETK